MSLLRLKYLKNYLFLICLSLKRNVRKIFGKNIYHVIGDSHVLNFLDSIFVIHHIGPATAYRLGFAKSTTNSRYKTLKLLKKISKEKNPNVIFVFGEIDARIHIYKIHKEKKISLNNVIRNTINSYIKFLVYVKRKYPNLNIYVFNILPTGEEKNKYKVSFYAQRKIRNKIVVLFNRYLEDEARNNNFKFIDIYKYLVDANQHRKKDYIFDEAHYNVKIIPFVSSWLQTYE